LVAGVVFVIGDAPDVAVIGPACAVADMEVIADGKHGLAGRGGRHINGLETLVVIERVRNARERGGIAADKAEQLAVCRAER
jgi:hypothetical protein